MADESVPRQRGDKAQAAFERAVARERRSILVRERAAWTHHEAAAHADEQARAETDLGRRAYWMSRADKELIRAEAVQQRAEDVRARLRSERVDPDG
jgi:hypothetical protein